MEHIMEFNQWVTTTTDSSVKDVDYHFITSQKLLYGIHEIRVTYDRTTIKANAKFDTGARSSSIDLKLAEKLGIKEELIKAYQDLEKVEIPKTLSKEEKEKMEKEYSDTYSKKYPGITSVQISKSASGFTIRPYVRLQLEINGRLIFTEANLKDRSGLQAEMLVGLADML